VLILSWLVCMSGLLSQCLTERSVIWCSSSIILLFEGHFANASYYIY